MAPAQQSASSPNSPYCEIETPAKPTPSPSIRWRSNRSPTKVSRKWEFQRYFPKTFGSSPALRQITPPRDVSGLQESPPIAGFQKKGQLIGLRHCLAGAGVLFAPVSVPIPCKQGILQGICNSRRRCTSSTRPILRIKDENRRIPCASKGIHFELKATIRIREDKSSSPSEGWLRHLLKLSVGNTRTKPAEVSAWMK